MEIDVCPCSFSYSIWEHLQLHSVAIRVRVEIWTQPEFIVIFSLMKAIQSESDWRSEKLPIWIILDHQDVI